MEIQEWKYIHTKIYKIRCALHIYNLTSRERKRQVRSEGEKFGLGKLLVGSLNESVRSETE